MFLTVIIDSACVTGNGDDNRGRGNGSSFDCNCAGGSLAAVHGRDSDRSSAGRFRRYNAVCHCCNAGIAAAPGHGLVGSVIRRNVRNKLRSIAFCHLKGIFVQCDAGDRNNRSRFVIDLFEDVDRRSVSICQTGIVYMIICKVAVGAFKIILVGLRSIRVAIGGAGVFEEPQQILSVGSIMPVLASVVAASLCRSIHAETAGRVGI